MTDNVFEFPGARREKPALPTLSEGTSNLLQVVYDWLLAGGHAPMLIVRRLGTTGVPDNYWNDDLIALTLRPEAVRSLAISEQGVSFWAGFGAYHGPVHVDGSAVLGLVAQDNQSIGLMLGLRLTPAPTLGKTTVESPRQLVIAKPEPEAS